MRAAAALYGFMVAALMLWYALLAAAAALPLDPEVIPLAVGE